VVLANGHRISSTHTGTLNIDGFPPEASEAHVFGNADLKNNLFHMQAACDSGCTVSFDKSSIKIVDKSGAILLEGSRDPSCHDNMWMLHIGKEEHSANGAVTSDEQASAPAPPEDCEELAPVPPEDREVLDATGHTTPAEAECTPLPLPLTHTTDTTRNRLKSAVARLNTAGGPRTMSQLVEWYHKAFGSPAREPFATAVDNRWIDIPGLTGQNIRQHLKPSAATAKGHLDQSIQGRDSTKIKIVEATDIDPPSVGKRYVVTHIMRTNDFKTSGFHSDQMGKFPVTSSGGHAYTMVFVDEQTGFIHAEPIKSRQGSDITQGYKVATIFFANKPAPFKPTYARLDNETSDELETYLRSQGLEIQYVEPGCHRALRAERAIRTWKNHFTAIIATTDKDFPLHQWHELMPAAEITLNLLRGSTVAPKISAWHMLHGKPYNFSAHPLAPSGIKVIVHNKPKHRGSHSFHGEEGFYLGPAMNHYRSHRVHATASKEVRVSQTVQWLPTDLILPGTSIHEALIGDIEQLLLTLNSLPEKDIGRQPAEALRHPLNELRKHTQEIIQCRQEDPAAVPAESAETAAPATSSDPAAEQRVGTEHDEATPAHESATDSDGPARITFAQGTKGAARDERVLTTGGFTGKPLPKPKPPTKSALKKSAKMLEEREIYAKKIIKEQEEQKLGAEKAEREQEERKLSAKKAEQELEERKLSAEKTEKEKWERKLSARKAEKKQKEGKLRAKKAATNQKEREFIAKKTAKKIAREQEVEGHRATISATAALKRADEAARPTSTASARPRRSGKRNPRYANAATRNSQRKARYANAATRCDANQFHTTLQAQIKKVAPQITRESSMIKLEKSICKWEDARTERHANTASTQCSDSATDLITAAILDATPPQTHSANAAGKAPITFRSVMRGEDKRDWETALETEYRKLLKGHQNSVMHAIRRNQKRTGAVSSYFNPQVKEKIKIGKLERRVRGTFGGDRTSYVGNVSAWVANINVVKIMLNHTVSKEGSIPFCLDITDYYLGTPMNPEMYEYLSIPLRDIPSTIRKEFGLDTFAENDSVMFEVTKGMYGLPVAGRIAQDRLKALLARHGYEEKRNTPCLFGHKTRKTTFTLVVDDFFCVAMSEDDKNHLINAVKELYEITIDHKASKYLGLKLDWEEDMTSVLITMPNRIKQACERFGIESPAKPIDSPAAYTKPVYGKNIQQMSSVDLSAPLNAADKKFVQEVIGTLTHYARMVDPTMLRDVSRLASRQATPTKDVLNDVIRLMQYAASHPDAGIRYRRSDMNLQGHSDASGQTETFARSRAGGLHFLTTNEGLGDPAAINGAIEVISTIIPSVCGSVAEAEFASLYLNGQTAEVLRTILADLGYPQGATPIFVDNKCAVGLANDQMKQKRSRAFDLQYYWTKDRQKQGHLDIIWAPGVTNLADYFTKAFPAQHHRDVRATYVANSAKSSAKQ